MTGNCGTSLAPLTLSARPPGPLDLLSPNPDDFFTDFGAYLDRLDSEPAATNALCQAGHASPSVEAMADLTRPADAGEISSMRRRLEQALDAGAIGLGYAPAAASPTTEIVALAEVMGQGRGLHTT